MAVYKDNNKTKDGRCWYFSCYKDNKKYKSKRFLTKQEAKEEEALFLLKRDNPSRKKFSIVALDYFDKISNIRKVSTVYSYKKDYNNHIKPFFDDLDINSINTQIIRKWSLEMAKKGLSVNYMNKIYNILCNIFNFAMKNYNLASNPAKMYGCFESKNDKVIKDEEKIRYITLEDFNKFISVIDNITWKTFFTFAYYTGCRRGEIQALKWNDINFNNNTISINKTLYEEIKGEPQITSTKNNLNRKIKMSKTLIDQLNIYKEEMQLYDDFNNNWYVFGNTRFLPKTTIDRNKHKYFQLSDVKEITMHEFRHSHVSLLINEYIKSGQTDTAKFFLMMSDRMGHTIQVMQETYLHFFPTMQDEIVDLLDNL